MRIYSDLKVACLESLSSDPAPGTTGRIIWNLTSLQVKTDDGTNIRALLRNDQKLIIGSNGTAANNVRWNRSANGLLQLVIGSDVTAEGTLSTSLAQLSSRIENYTDAGKPSVGNAGRLVYTTDTKLLELDNGAAYQQVLSTTTPPLALGDILVFGPSGLTKLTVGANSTVLIADSTATNGIKWGTNLPSNSSYRSVTTTDTATTSDDTLALSGASFSETLFTAVGNQGKKITLLHKGTSLSQKYTILTTGGQAINGPNGAVTSGNYILCTTGEKLTLISNGTDWDVDSHKTETDWIVDSTATINYITFTVASASATIAATYVPAYVFTVTAANATVGATYTNNVNTFTVAQTIAGATTLITTGPNPPTLGGGTLTKATGTGDATITFSGVTGTGSGAGPFTVSKTIAALTTLITQGQSTSIPTSGKLVKTAGTGDTIITYSNFTGSAIRHSGTTTTALTYGSPTVNSVKFRRRGNEMTIWSQFYQATVGAVAGSGDWVHALPTGALINTTTFPIASITDLPAGTDFIETPDKTNFFFNNAAGRADDLNTPAYYQFFQAVPFSTSTYRIYGALDGATDPNFAMSTGQINGVHLMAWNFYATFPISDWQV